MARLGQTYWTECGRASKSTCGNGGDGVGAFFPMAAIGGGCRARERARRWRDEQAGVHVVKRQREARTERVWGLTGIDSRAGGVWLY